MGILAHTCSTAMAAFPMYKMPNLHNSVPGDEGAGLAGIHDDPHKIDSEVARLRGMKPLGQVLERDLGEWGRPEEEKRYVAAASDNLWLRSRRSEIEQRQEQPAFWLRARKTPDEEPGFWLRARRAEHEPGFWLRARKESKDEEPAVWLRARKRAAYSWRPGSSLSFRGTPRETRAQSGDAGFWLRSRKSDDSAAHIWLRSKKSNGQAENVL